MVTPVNTNPASGADARVPFSRDYKMSYVISVDGPGARAENKIMDYEDLQSLAPEKFIDTFPHGVSFSVAFIRLYRFQWRLKALIECKAAEPDEMYHYTRYHILNENDDMILQCPSKLMDMKWNVIFDVSNLKYCGLKNSFVYFDYFSNFSVRLSMDISATLAVHTAVAVLHSIGFAADSAVNCPQVVPNWF